MGLGTTSIKQYLSSCNARQWGVCETVDANRSVDDYLNGEVKLHMPKW